MSALAAGLEKRRRPQSRAIGAASAELPLDGYFRIRDFEYVQPLYDLAFLLEVEALAKGIEVPEYRTFSLWRAAYSLDGYGTTIDRWLTGVIGNDGLDYVPSSRIRQYLTRIRRSGTIPELRKYRNERFYRCLRLRSVRGLGPSKIALTVSSRSLSDEWFSQAAIGLSLERDRITELYLGSNGGPWQTAHIVPPLLRLLHRAEENYGRPLDWQLAGIADPFEPVAGAVSVAVNLPWNLVSDAIEGALKREKLFRRDNQEEKEGIRVRHQLGWSVVVRPTIEKTSSRTILELAELLDPIGSTVRSELLSDLHMHTAWSDGSASVEAMANAVVSRGLQYFAVTDHSRSSKLQGGLTPLLWLRQANALALASPVCPVLHGVEVDILRDGTLDLPKSLLAAADIVVASVHSNWTDDSRANTDRLLRAIESGTIDILAHPTSALIGKPGVPDYVRAPADVHWDDVFAKCARWCVAVEVNCFPSRLDLPIDLLTRAVQAGCAIALGSDSHARSHLLNLRFGDAILRRIDAPLVLNKFSYEGLKTWIRDSREIRKSLERDVTGLSQSELQFDTMTNSREQLLRAKTQLVRAIPAGSRVVGIDLTAGHKATGIALLDKCTVETCSLVSDEEILAYVEKHDPRIVSIDSPLGLPGGGAAIDPKAGIVRVAEHDLASVGIPAYPALIDSMRNLTLRGIRLRLEIERLPNRPRVIESYPGAAQDILCIPRKQKSLELLREGLRRLGLSGPGLATRSHDEMDAITSAVVGRFFEAGLFEPMGIPAEAQLIVPKIRPLIFDQSPIICLGGKTGAGKSVVARYLSVFYGFDWIRTRDVIRQLLIDDLDRPDGQRFFGRRVDPQAITELDLQEFGAVILDKYKQEPLRKSLTDALADSDAPIVVDSIRDVLDVSRSRLPLRPVLVWFIDCPDALIRERLARKTKLGAKRIGTSSPVDRTAATIHRQADAVIHNAGSLEELRWRLDDALFSRLSLSAH